MQARDRLDNQALAARQSGNFTQLSVFRFLMEHTWWKGDDYGWVNQRWVKHQNLAWGLGCSTKTVQRALLDLEKGGLIKRSEQGIYLSWINS